MFASAINVNFVAPKVSRVLARMDCKSSSEAAASAPSMNESARCKCALFAFSTQSLLSER
jgi:hypothetical protein